MARVAVMEEKKEGVEEGAGEGGLGEDALEVAQGEVGPGDFSVFGGEEEGGVEVGRGFEGGAEGEV